MAYESAVAPITLPFGSTGIRQYRFVTLNASGQITYPSTAGPSVLGVLISSGTTGSTDSSNKYGVVQMYGVAKVEAPGSTVSAGDLVAASSVGYAVALASGDYCVGRAVTGSSGSTNRLLSVALLPIGTT
jgi:hypothetical protein